MSAVAISVLAVPVAIEDGDGFHGLPPKQPNGKKTNMVASLALLATADILIAFLPLLGK
jgi:hypothetical protein